MTRKDPVTPEMAEAVIERDRQAMVRASVDFLGSPVCIAPILELGAWTDCWGRSTIEHVKAQLRMGKRAEPRPDRLVTLCMGHTEPGTKAGLSWNATKANRAKVRAYLEEVPV